MSPDRSRREGMAYWIGLVLRWAVMASPFLVFYLAMTFFTHLVLPHGPPIVWTLIPVLTTSLLVIESVRKKRQ